MTTPLISRKLARQTEWLTVYAEVKDIAIACQKADVPKGTLDGWRHKDRHFRDRYNSAYDKATHFHHSAKTASKANYGLLYNHRRDLPAKGGFIPWRQKYIGRTTPEHQQEFIEAVEDLSNLVVILTGPPGMGKDTTAGDLALYESCDNRDLRLAWIMKGENFAKRRVGERLDPYLTDPKTYSNAPPGRDSTIPTHSLIDDYGPFKYRKGMVDVSGNKLEPTTWTKNEIYFLKAGAPEADPNLWATGVEGQLYGSRVDRMVWSDIFDRENQTNPTARQGQYDWCMGTAMSRLDESGRLYCLWTRSLAGDNQERITNSLVGEAAVVSSGKYSTKYANGVAVITIPAIQTDQNGQEVSYWPDRFPLDSQWELPDGTWLPTATADQKALQAEYGGQVKRIRGLREIRDRDRDLFETMYQQNPPLEVTGDFTDTVLDAPDDETRSLEIYKPHERLVVGAAPARSAGAAWFCWGVDRDAGTITAIDFFYGTRLGISGLKQKLVTYPIVKYTPVWYAYETNREAAVVEAPEIQRVFKDYGVNLARHTTHHANRTQTGTRIIGVPSLSFYMRSRVIRWPAMTRHDKDRMRLVKEHFKTWDRKEALNTNRTLKGQPDDLAMAAWVGFVKAIELLERRSGGVARTMPIPDSVKRRWERHQQRSREKEYEKDKNKYRHPAPDMAEVIALATGDAYDNN